MADHNREHTLQIISDGGKVPYSFETTGGITKVTANPHDSLNGKSVEGHCWNGEDTYGYNGALIDFTVADRGFPFATMKRDGIKKAPAHLTMHRIELRAGNQPSTYGLASSGKMIRTKDEGFDVIEGDTEAEGKMQPGGVDVYRFQGGLSTLWSNTDITVVKNDGQPEPLKGSVPGRSPGN